LDKGPFPLHHPDIHNGNILYDDNNNIVGVIDWTASDSFPWGIVMAPPEVLDQFPERRKMYIDIFEVKEIAITGGKRFASFMRSPASEIVNLVNENYRSWGKRFPDRRAARLAQLVYGSEERRQDKNHRMGVGRNGEVIIILFYLRRIILVVFAWRIEINEHVTKRGVQLLS